MSYKTVRDRSLADGVLYEDPEFPAAHKSVYYSKVDSKIQWKRPKVRSEIRDVNLHIHEFDITSEAYWTQVWTPGPGTPSSRPGTPNGTP